MGMNVSSSVSHTWTGIDSKISVRHFKCRQVNCSMIVKVSNYATFLSNENWLVILSHGRRTFKTTQTQHISSRLNTIQ